MPTYDYVCEACGDTFEHFQSMSSNILRTCQKCKKRKLRRLIGSGAGVIFKGSGFYETDYKRKGKPPSESEKGDAAKAESNKADTSAEKSDSAKSDSQKSGSTSDKASKSGSDSNSKSDK